MQDLIQKWGLDKDMEISKFRFNQGFNMLNADRYLKNLFNSHEFRAAMPNWASKFATNVESVQFDKMSIEVVNMGFFDLLPENDITTDNGYIKKEPDELLDGLQLSDRLRYALAFEESEYYEVFDDQMRKEFIFNVFKHLVLGGGVCQYEDYVNEYLTQTQLLYKDLVTVFKDSETNDIRVGSHVLKITKIDDEDLFKDPDHPQNWMYVIVDPIHWHVNIWFNQWKSWW